MQIRGQLGMRLKSNTMSITFMKACPLFNKIMTNKISLYSRNLPDYSLREQKFLTQVCCRRQVTALIVIDDNKSLALKYDNTCMALFERRFAKVT